MSGKEETIRAQVRMQAQRENQQPGKEEAF
jgi:hypothetical protein